MRNVFLTVTTVRLLIACIFCFFLFLLSFSLSISLLRWFLSFAIWFGNVYSIVCAFVFCFLYRFCLFCLFCCLWAIKKNPKKTSLWICLTDVFCDEFSRTLLYTWYATHMYYIHYPFWKVFRIRIYTLFRSAYFNWNELNRINIISAIINAVVGAVCFF